MARHHGVELRSALLCGLLLPLGAAMTASAEAPRATQPGEGQKESTTRRDTFTIKSWTERLPYRVDGEIEIGGQTLSGHTNSPTLKEYRDLDGKPTIPRLRLKTEDELASRFLEFGGINMTRTDASYFLRAGQYNTFQFDFEFDRLPHTIGLNRTTIYGEADNGRFTLPAGPPTAATFNAVSGTPTQAQRNAVEAVVNSLLRATDLGFQTDTARIGLRYLPEPHLELKGNYTRIDKDGRVPFGTVIGSPGSGVVELPVLRKERSHELTAGAEYARDWYQFRFNYTGSLFENDVRQVEWEGVCGTTACGNTSGLGRASTMPDNFAHSFTGSGAITLPWWKTRLTAAASYSLWRQNETFLPYTTIAGFTGNTTNTGASSPDAKMNVLLSNIGLSSRPLRDVTLTARYRYYQLDNETPVHRFTNVLHPGDIRPVLGAANASRANVPIGFRRENFGTDGTWRITSQLTAKVGYEWEHWVRTLREARDSSEHVAKAAMDYKPNNWILSRVTYSHGVRTIGADGYLPLGGNAVALPLLRKFDEADRTRDKGEIFLESSPLDTVTVSGSLFAQLDTFFNSAFGLQNARAYGWSGDVSWTPFERLNLFTGYAHDDYQSRQRGCLISGSPTCNEANAYITRPRDILDTFHTGLTLLLIPHRLDLDLAYRYTFGRSKREQSSTSGGAPAGEPAVVPEIKNVFHVITAAARYYFTPQWTLKLVYLYERYRETDFTVDNVTPSLANVSVEGFRTPAAGDVRSVLIPIQHPSYEAHIVGFSIGYRF